MPGTVGELQVLMATHGHWLDQDKAEALKAECDAGMPQDIFVQEAMKVSRPLTDDEARKMKAAGLLVGRA